MDKRDKHIGELEAENEQLKIENAILRQVVENLSRQPIVVDSTSTEIGEYHSQTIFYNNPLSLTGGQYLVGR